MRLLVIASVAAACTGSIDTGTRDGGAPRDAAEPVSLFEPASPATYVTKVKNLLVGLPATDDEIAQVTADPAKLRDLIDAWMAQPAFEERSLDFFRNAFQQNQARIDAAFDNSGNGAFPMNNNYRGRLERTLMDSFPKTVWALVQGGRPLTEALTTDTYLLTTAQLVVLSYLDENNRKDDNTVVNRLDARNAITTAITFDPAVTATYAQSIDPTNASYMKFKNRSGEVANCTPDVTTYAATNPAKYARLLNDIFGQGFGSCHTTGSSPPVVRNPAYSPQLADQDFIDWRRVQLRPIADTATTSPSFWNLPALRAATTLSLHTRRVGFAGTLAFAANWGTNADNALRVTANQMLIVGIGRSINGAGVTSAFPVDAAAEDHVSNPACAGCHDQLDPMRQFLRQSYTVFYAPQTDAAQTGLPARFQIDGVDMQGAGVADLAAILASHPRFAIAWTKKLYFWATSREAEESDPELQRVAQVFAESGYAYKALVRELLSSPLVTYATETQTTRHQGNTLSTTRRDQLCTALSNRLGISDVCGMTTPVPTTSQRNIAQVAALIASDTYFRSYELPSLPTEPDLFFRASVESLCGEVAKLVVDPASGTNRYPSADPPTAIAGMVHDIVGFPPGDPRTARAVQILTGHHTAAAATSGVSATDALRSTFQLACQAPTNAIVGL